MPGIKLIWIVGFLSLFFHPLRAQDAGKKNIIIKVIDAESGEYLPLANIFFKENQGITTDENGAAVIPVGSDTLSVKISFLGYKTYNGNVSANSNPNEIRLQPESIRTEEVVINSSQLRDDIQSTETGLEKLRMEEIKELPVLLGETDVLKTVQLLPGVQAGSEGNTGFFVRGGSVDQNLILLDNIPIYNPSHLFGFFSIFNSFIVSDLELTKSGFPARLGGRVSSALSIRSVDPDKNATDFEANIGTVAISGSLQHPIVKGKLSQQLALRRTYVDVLARTLFPDNEKIKNQTNYFFGDLNYKIDFLASDRDRVSANFYYGKDEFHYTGKNNFRNNTHWTNALGGVHWTHSFGPQLLQTSTLYWTHYNINFIADLSSYYLEIFSQIRDVGFKSDWFYDQLLPGHNFSAGFQVVNHLYVPNNFTIEVSGEAFNTGPETELHGWDAAAYLEDEFAISDAVSARVGFRVNHYRQTGPFKRYFSDENYQLTDSVSYGEREKIQEYNTFEPRVSMRYLLNKDHALKASLDFTSQFVHLAPISSVSLPTDVWVPSSQQLRPQKSVQYSLAYSGIVSTEYEISLAAYYKSMKNLIEYRNGVVLGYGAGYNFDDNFVAGDSESKGVEFQAKKTSGPVTGWLSYTLAKTTRSFPDLNEGKPFPAKYDRRHDINLTVNYQFNDRWSFSGVFVFGTGNALTLPVGRYVIDGNVINDYGGRNNFRMPSYHRMDLSATLRPRNKGRWNGEWIFSIYNVYNRKNPYYIYFDIDGDLEEYRLEIEPVQVALFPVLPSIAYRISL